MKKSLILLVTAAMLLSACGTNNATPAPALTEVSQALQPTATAVPPTETARPTPLPPTSTPLPTETATPLPPLFPSVTLTANTTCRMGPDKNYYRVADFKSGQVAQVQGRSADSQWLNVMAETPNKNFTCWLPLESVKAFDGVPALRLVTAIPLPTGPSSATVRERPYCGINKAQGSVVVDWSPYAEGTGFIVYRNGVNLTTVYGGEYIDHDTPGSKTPYTLSYVIQAFNSVGVSKVSAGVSITLCD